MKHSGVKERLKAFNFHDLHITEQQAYELLEVSFTEKENEVIVSYGNRLLSEADEIEDKQERVLFYYDSIEALTEKLQSNEAGHLNRSDLLAILEILQVFCIEDDFPAFMDESISTLLGFFTEG